MGENLWANTYSPSEQFEESNLVPVSPYLYELDLSLLAQSYMHFLSDRRPLERNHNLRITSSQDVC
jgi:hypothetical protein